MINPTATRLQRINIQILLKEETEESGFEGKAKGLMDKRAQLAMFLFA